MDIMKKLISLILPTFILSACGAKTMTEFDWLASESAPQNYPMEIVSGTFHFREGGEIYVPSAVLLYELDWGQYRSTHVSGEALKPVPNKLSITFFSYTENKFYQGEFDLPDDKILTLFQQEYYSTKEQGMTRYYTIIAGVSPGGGVAVWLNGLNRNTQVFYGKAKEVSLDWSVKTKNKMPREAYVNETLEDTVSKEMISELETKGAPVNLWDDFQNSYHWQLNLLTENRAPKLVNEIRYVNGEIDYFFYPLSEDIAKQTRAVPKSLYYSWKSPQGKPLALYYEFDVNELSNVFNEFEARKPATADEPMLLTLQLWEREDGRRWGVAVQRGDEEVVLRKVKLEIRRSNSELDDADAFYQHDE
jgi:hypothetical protein